MTAGARLAQAGPQSDRRARARAKSAGTRAQAPAERAEVGCTNAPAQASACARVYVSRYIARGSERVGEAAARREGKVDVFRHLTLPFTLHGSRRRQDPRKQRTHEGKSAFHSGPLHSRARGQEDTSESEREREAVQDSQGGCAWRVRAAQRHRLKVQIHSYTARHDDAPRGSTETAERKREERRSTNVLPRLSSPRLSLSPLRFSSALTLLK